MTCGLAVVEGPGGREVDWLYVEEDRADQWPLTGSPAASRSRWLALLKSHIFSRYAALLRSCSSSHEDKQHFVGAPYTVVVCRRCQESPSLFQHCIGIQVPI